MTLPKGRDQHWSLDFVGDKLISSLRNRILPVVNDVMCERWSLVVDTSLSGMPAVRELKAIIAIRGMLPLMIVSDNATELTSLVILKWTQERPVG